MVERRCEWLRPEVVVEVRTNEVGGAGGGERRAIAAAGSDRALTARGEWEGERGKIKVRKEAEG